LVESYFTNFKDYRNEHPTTIIDKMIQQTAFYPQPVTNAQNAVSVSDWDNATDINEFNSAIDDAIRGNKAFISRKNKTEYSSDFKKLSNKSHFKIEVGDTVFSRINELVSSYGYDVIYQQDGTLFIGDISKKRVNESPQVKHNLRLSENEDITNVIGWDISEDTSALYSSITVISQSQNGTNKSSTAKDSTVLDKKNQVIQINEDDISPQDLAIRVREDNKISSARYSYRMGDHVDEVGVPFGVNRTAILNDSHNDINGEFVIYNTTFSFSLTEGYTTELVLSYPRRKGLNV
jgi:prophage tail gpP-like protein